MIKFNMKKIVLQRGIKRPLAFLIRQGFSKYTASSIIDDRVKKISDEMLEKFCYLFNCVPHDFMEWYPDEKLPNAEKQQLSILIPKENTLEDYNELKKFMYLMPVSRIGELKKKAEELAYKKD